MPVAVNMPGRQPQPDPLDKLANALNVAKTGFGIYSDMKMLESVKSKKAEEDQLRQLQIKKLEGEQSQADEDNNPNSPLMATMREAAKKRGVTLPEGITPKQARTNFDAFIKPKDPKVRDPLAEELARERLNALKAPKKNVQEFSKRYKNIQTQIANLDKLVEADGTAEVFGDHEAKLKQTIDSIAIDAAKLFDPESVARESEVAAFRNMLFTPGDSMTADGTARGSLENFKKIIQSRAENEGLANLIPSEDGKSPGGEVPADIKQQAAAILAKRRAQAKK